MGVLFGLGAAFGWGTADLFARFGGRRVGAYRALLYMQPVGLIMLTFYLFVIDSNLKWDWWALGGGVIIALMNTMAGLCLFRAMEIGTLAIVSPIASSYGAITLSLALLVSGERPAPLQMVGLLITIGGVILASLQPQALKFAEKKNNRGVRLAIAAAIMFGVAFWGLKYITPVIGGAMTVWENRIIGPIFLLLLARPLRQSLDFPPRSAWIFIFINGVIDTLAYLSFSIGLTSADAGIVTVISSMFAAITVLLAWIFLKERLARIQWVGVLTILMGVALVSTS